MKAEAHRLTVLAYERPRKPNTRGEFPAVMAVIEATLRSGRDAMELRRVIETDGVEVWTRDGVSTALARRRAARSQTDNARDQLRAMRRGIAEERTQS